MKVYLIVLLLFTVGCSQNIKRSPASVLLDANEVSERKSFLLEKFRTDPDYFFVNNEKQKQIFVLIDKLRFKSQFDIFEEAFERGMFRVGILEDLMMVTRPQDVQLIKDYSKALFTQKDPVIAQALKIIVSDELNIEQGKFKKAYFDALSTKDFKHTNLAYLIVSKSKNINKDVIDNALYVLRPKAYRINEIKSDLILNELNYTKGVHAQTYLLRMLNRDFGKFASTRFIKAHTYVTSSETLEFYLSYLSVMKRLNLAPSLEILVRLNKLSRNEGASATGLIQTMRINIEKMSEESVRGKNINRDINYLLDMISSHEITEQNYRSINHLFELSFSQNYSLNRRVLNLVFKSQNQYQSEFIRKIIIDTRDMGNSERTRVINRAQKALTKIVDPFTSDVAMNFSLSSSMSIVELEADRIDLIKSKAKILGLDYRDIYRTDSDFLESIVKIEKDISLFEGSERKRLLAKYLLLKNNVEDKNKEVVSQIIKAIIRMPEHMIEDHALFDVKAIESLIENNLAQAYENLGSHYFQGYFLLNPSLEKIELLQQTFAINRDSTGLIPFVSLVIERGYIPDVDNFSDISRLHLNAQQDDYISKLRERRMISKEVYDLLEESRDLLFNRLSFEDKELKMFRFELLDEVTKLPQWKRDFYLSLVSQGGSLLDSYEIVQRINQRKASKLKELSKIISSLSEDLSDGIEIGDEEFFRLKDKLLADFKVSIKLDEMKLLFNMAKLQKTKDLSNPQKQRIGPLHSCLKLIRSIFTGK